MIDFSTIQKIQEINSMFHEFEIENIEYVSNILSINVVLPWAKLWGDERYILSIKYGQCTLLDCEYYPILSDKKIEAYPGKFIYQSEERHSDQALEISSLKLKINNSSFNSPNTFIFWCESKLEIELAKIIFKAENIRLYNLENIEISTEQFYEWKNKWWEFIFG